MDDLKWEDARAAYYQHVHIDGRGKNEPRWRGVRVVKFPSDLIQYAQVSQKNKPTTIIETGTAFGGSALFLADMLTLNEGLSQVVTIDINNRHNLSDPRIHVVQGSSTDPSVYEKVKGLAAGRVMVVLDSDHSGHHVFKELQMYSKLVTKGQFIVVEDCYTKSERPYGPHWGVRQFLKRTKYFQLEPVEDQFIFAVSRGGWLRKI